MAAEHSFILDLTTVLGASAIGGYLAHRLRQPVLLGYLISGLLVGPFGFGLLQETEQISALAEMGVAFLLFALGVEFSLAELKRVKDIALKGSLLQIGLTILLVAILTFILGWADTPVQGIFLGAVLSLSSTAVVLKTLTERGETNTIQGQIMLAILIAQDLALGLMLAILPALNEPSNLVNALFAATLKAVLFFASALVAGYWFIPRLMKSFARTESSELFLLAVIALCLGVALITAALGLSIEMGAFVAGLMIAEIDYADQALAKILPLRDTFASLFFASIGMLIDPQVLWQNLGVILGFVALVMVGKALIIFPIIWQFGYSFKIALITSLGLNQIGEFSFVLALVGRDLNFISQDAYLLLLGTTAITLVVTPIGMKFSPRLANKLLELPPLAAYLRNRASRSAIFLPDKIRDHVVVAGYGRVGQILVKILRDRGYPVLVIDNSEAAIQRLRQEKLPYIFGDGDSELVLEKTHLEAAKALAITLPDPTSTRLLLKRALEFVPNLDVVARSHSDSEIDWLTQMGAKEVVQPEFEAALEMGNYMLSTLGEDKGAISDIIQAIRTDRYLSIRPKTTLSLLEKELIDATSAIHNEWITISEHSSLVNATLGEARVRDITGVTVMIVQRKGETLYYPSGETTLQISDRLLVIGTRSEVSAFRDLLEGKLSTTKEDLHWVSLKTDSSLAGMKVADFQRKYEVKLQGIRHQGHFYYPVEENIVLEKDDYLLLAGESKTFALLQDVVEKVSAR